MTRTAAPALTTAAPAASEVSVVSAVSEVTAVSAVSEVAAVTAVCDVRAVCEVREISEVRELTARPSRDPVSAHCGVCGSDEVLRDEVDSLPGGRTLLLAECAHCEHRWTSCGTSPPGAAARQAPPRPAGRVAVSSRGSAGPNRGEVPSAA